MPREEYSGFKRQVSLSNSNPITYLALLIDAHIFLSTFQNFLAPTSGNRLESNFQYYWHSQLKKVHLLCRVVCGITFSKAFLYQKAWKVGPWNKWNYCRVQFFQNHQMYHVDIYSSNIMYWATQLTIFLANTWTFVRTIVLAACWQLTAGLFKSAF